MKQPRWSAAPSSGLALVYLHTETGACFWRDDSKPRRARWHGEVAVTYHTKVMVDAPSLPAVIRCLTTAKITLDGKTLRWPDWAGWMPTAIGCYTRAHPLGAEIAPADRRYARDLARCEELGGEPDFPLVEREPRFDDSDQAGVSDRHYFWQDLWVARQVVQHSPCCHLDVGSRVDGFVAHLLAAGVGVRYIDCRPLPIKWPGLEVIQDDARTLASIPDGSCRSVSCLHALEHFGLGRYGDEVDPQGWRKGLKSLARVTAPGGRLYVSVPIGQQRREGNWHRVFTPTTIELLPEYDGMTFVDLAVVDDAGEFHPHAGLFDYEHARYACGIFTFEKGGC